jgi:hypothetical protein
LTIATKGLNLRARGNDSTESRNTGMNMRLSRPIALGFCLWSWGLLALAAPPRGEVVAPPREVVKEPTGPVLMPVGPRPGVIPAALPPPGVTLTTTPGVANLRWMADGRVTSYAVSRADGKSPPADLSSHVVYADDNSYFVVDQVPDMRVAYTYSVTAYFDNGTSAQTDVNFVSPPFVNPAGFIAQDQGNGRVLFQWQPVPGANTYRLDGPGVPNSGAWPQPSYAGDGTFLGMPTSLLIPNVPGGPGTWRLASVYPGNYADYAGASTASTIVHVLPPRSQPWLTKNNGPGALSQVQTPANQVIDDSPGGHSTGNPSGDLFPAYSSAEPGWLTRFYYTADNGQTFREDTGSPRRHLCASGENVDLGCARSGLKVWLDTNSLLWDEPGQGANEAVYGNPIDIGVGRRTACEQKMRGPPVPGLYTVCYATAHGVPPGQPGFNDPQTITHPQEGFSNDFILSMVIAKDATGTVFLAIKNQPSNNNLYGLLPAVSLDTEGPKFVPFVCLSCHGGTYNPATRKVDGASFLPLDPELLAFASPADQAAQEEKMRKINWIIANSNSSPAISAYVQGLYNGAPNQPGAHAQPDYVPAGWAPQAGLYRQAVRPYCTMCHLAQPNGSYNFASWGNFQSYAGLIRASVCGAHTMPHSELQFTSFWLKDTGALYLPGLLAASLGFPSC